MTKTINCSEGILRETTSEGRKGALPKYNSFNLQGIIQSPIHKGPKRER